MRRCSLITWRLEKVRQRSTRLFLLLSYSKAKTHVRYLHVVTTNGIVSRHWFDQHEYIDRYDLGDDFIRAKSPALEGAESQVDTYRFRKGKRSVLKGAIKR